MNLKRRLEGLEERHRAQTPPSEREAWGELLKRLTTDELRWLAEPSDRAESLVPCPHVDAFLCRCSSDVRTRRGFEAHPELEEEFIRRANTVLERTSEIMEREVWRRRTEQ